jgi:carbon-monoxide dehydrogenase large subunit
MTLGATRLVGQSVPRREDPRFLTGRTRFVDDVRLPRTVHAAFVRAPHAHAQVLRVGTGAALAVPGIAGALTGEEAARVARPIRGDLLLPGWRSSELPILGWPRVHFAGQAVAVVAAADRYLAEDAAERVQVEYEPLPVVADLAQAVSPVSPRVHEAWPDNVYLERWMAAGDVAEALAQADVVIERTFRTHRHTAVPLEGRACLADWDPASRSLTVHASTQIPHLLRTALADTLGLPEHHMRVVAGDVGGGFGVKTHLFPEDVAVCLLAMKLGRPVKWVEDMREHLLASTHAHEHLHQVALAARRDGTITALRAEILVDAGAYSVWPESAAAEATQAARVLVGPYTIRRYAAHTRAVATNKCPIGAYRGVGRPAAVFTMERMVDELARELGLDPVEVRLRNFIPDDAYPYTTVTGLEYDSASLVASLRKASEAIGYDAFRQDQAAARAAGRHRGIGFGAFLEQTAHTTREYAGRGATIVRGYDTVTVALDPSGTVTVDSSLHAHGQGHETTFAQVVAERLGVPLDAVRVRSGDTRSAPYGMGTYASRSAVLGGGAGWKAADAVRAALLMIAAHLMEASAGDLEIADGVISVKGSPRSRMTVAEVARIAFHRPERLPPGVLPSALASTQAYDAHPGTGTFSNAVHAATVEVDIATGRVAILRYVVVEDCGTMINPLIVDGQVHGGTAQGIGGALLEHLVYDERGQLLSQTLAEYLLPGALDVPAIDVLHLQTPGFTLGGIKGVGEGGAIAPLATLANAIADALGPLGATVDTLPLHPERVLALIDRAEGSGSP